jgi:hypothetical protein
MKSPAVSGAFLLGAGQGRELEVESCMIIRLLLLSLSVFAFEATAESKLLYKDVQPLLKKHCLRCHSGIFPQGKLRLTSAKKSLKGGKSGPAVVSGNAAGSLLIQAVTADPKDPKFMPPSDKGISLSAEEIEKLKSWINQGAK